MARTSQALNSVKAMQAAAQAAARAGANNLGVNPNNPALQLPNVPDGLAPGGLQFVSATGASAPTQGSGGRGTQVTVKQNVQQALINWSKFNIGKNTTLKFDQSDGGADVSQWVAFNKVNDPSGQPSQILGSITASGQVYVINQNGIIFGGSSQVNTHTLVASSLPLNENLITRGLLNNPDAQFLFSALAIPAGSKGPTPAFTPPAPPPGGRYGDVTVQPGAQLTAPTSAAKVGGRIMLVGANVTNAGSISTLDGQTILAAGLQVGIDAHSSSDPSLRGLDVYVGVVTDPTSVLAPYAGTATNTGLIEALRGNVTITGKTVNQLAAINSSTSVSLNGRIDLIASYGALRNVFYDPVRSTEPPFHYTSAGDVMLGPSSLTQILPEWDSTEKAVGSQLSLRSQANLQGKSIYLAPGAVILAPSAVLKANAGVWNYVQEASAARSAFVNSGGQIYLDRGAMINVAGSTDIAAPLSQYILSVTLRGAEFADSPLQRTSIFRPGDGSNPSITVDLRKTGTYNGRTWYGTPLADLSGYLGLIERTVGELTTAGGTVTLSAGDSVVLQPGALVDVSGGFINFGGGHVTTTRVLYANHLIEIADATPNRLYQGIFTGTFTESHPRWGVTNTYKIPWMLGEHYEQPYTQGADGGILNLQAGAMALDGDFFGNTVAGPRERSSPPDPGTLSIAFEAQQLATPYPKFSPTPPTVSFEEGRLSPADPFALDGAGNPLPLRADRIADVILNPDLFSVRGFGIFTLTNYDGDIKVPRSSALIVTPKGSITMSGANIDVQGSITVPGGTVNLSVFNISPPTADSLRASAGSVTPPPNADRGNFALGSSGAINTAGLIIDDRMSSRSPGSLPLVTNGGAVSITTYNADLSKGSLIDVSGGVAVSTAGKMNYGDAGSISIKAGQDPNLKSVLGGHLKLGGTLLGFSGAKGGSLTLQAPVIQIGGTSPSVNALLLKPDFFSESGFASFTLIGLGEATGNSDEMIPGVSVAAGTVIAPEVKSYLALPHEWESGGVVMVPVLKPEGLRSPLSLTLSAPGVQNDFTGLLTVRGDIIIGAGSRIQTDALGSVTLGGHTVAVFGSIIAPGGAISISGSSNSLSTFASRPEAELRALTTVHLAAGSLLSTAGKVVLLPDRWGHRTGYVLPGGTISVSGNIYAESGAKLDVSGASGILDLPPAYLGLNVPMNAPLLGSTLVPVTSGVNLPLYAAFTVPLRVDSSGGTITLKGGQQLFTAATLLGNAGGPTALGGNLSISSGRFYPLLSQPQDRKPTDVTLRVTQSDPGFTSGSSGIGLPVLDTTGGPILGGGQFAVNDFSRGGFDSLLLGGTLEFKGPVTINARRTIVAGVPSSSSSIDGGVIYADSNVQLTAPYVALGKPFEPPVQPLELQNSPPYIDGLSDPFNFLPTFGPGRLTVTADLIDVGNLSLQNIGVTVLIANGGDIRGQGTFDVAGSLLLRAGQIYPVTASPFTIVAHDYNPGGGTVSGSVIIEGSGVRPLPLSAGGTLNIYSSLITQGGTLRAPFGGINLGWDGTGTAPKDIITGQNVPVTKQLTLTAGSVTSVSGVDPRTGQGIIIPYGINPTGEAWIDPTGLDITAGGGPSKTVTISAQKLTTEAGSVIDISGGGDLYAYQWIRGNGGSQDILDSSTSFAVIPGYGFNYMPYAPFSITTTGATNLDGDSGYVNSSLSVGDRVFLNASQGLPAGTYTLLPARYALLPNAVLVTPQTGSPIGTFNLPDGSSLVNGYRYNDLNNSRSVPSIYSRFEVASSTVVRQRSQYADYFANSFLRESAIKLDQKAPRLPVDAGYLLLSATQAMAVQGSVLARGASSGRGGNIDISTPIEILISSNGASGGAGVLTLDSDLLNSYGADSLLIGGSRSFGTDSTTVNVRTNKITVDNAGTSLSGPEIILVSAQELIFATGASVLQTGSLSDAADTLLLGDAALPGSGNGVLLRVSSDPAAQIVRSGITSSNVPNLSVGAGVTLSGASLILDSTARMSIDPTAALIGQAITLDAGRISMQLTSPGSLQADPGLVLTGNVLSGLQSAQSLSLLSYSAFDIYGTGGFSTTGSLALHAAEIRGFNNGGGTVTLAAPTILLDNSPGRPSPGPVIAASGTLVFDASTITIGKGQLNIDQFSTVILNASGGILMQGAGGLAAQNALTANTPMLTGAKGATQSLTAGGALNLLKPPGTVASVSGGLGASIDLSGTTINISSDILLPSGILTVRATGGVAVSGTLNAGGTAQTFFDQVRYTEGGQITLASLTGNVDVAAGGFLNVAAQPGGGNAGRITINASAGAFNLAGTMAGSGGAGGLDGSFSLDVGSLPDYTTLNNTLNAASFSQSRTLRVRSGDVTVTGTGANATIARIFSLSTDQGSINVAGEINASGATGGKISLVAWRNVVLQSGSLVTVAAQDFNNAGKGGVVFLEVGSSVFSGGTYGAGPGAVLDIRSGSAVDLSVASNIPASTIAAAASTSISFPATANGFNTIIATSSGTITLVDGRTIPLAANVVSGVVQGQSVTLNSAGTITFGGSAASGEFTGTLRLRAPQNVAGTNLSVNPINGTITGASAITVEGYRIFTPAGGNITTAIQSSINTSLTTFGNNAITLRNSLLAANASVLSLTPITVVLPGAEVINRTGDLTLGTSSSAASVDWNLATFRYGANSVPGVLTMRAGGDIVLFNAISDGFTTSAYNSSLLTANAALPVNVQSWSYRFATGADFTAADIHGVQSLTALNTSFPNKGSLLIGKNGGLNSASSPGANATTTSAVNAGTGRFQVIRTGTGDIDISAGRNLQLLNQFASIYTVGVQVPDLTMRSTFDRPVPSMSGSSVGNLGANQQLPPYSAQYTFGGGNVSITAGADLLRQTRDISNNLIADSERELPMNWLYRRGYVDPVTGLFGRSRFGEVASTSWWVDFSNFFEGVGALGGGNVTLIAGRDVTNIDGLVPTNARMTGRSGVTAIAPDAANLVEFGGGDLTVQAGRNIDGGVYYVERGTGTLNAGGSITTNSTRSPSLTILNSSAPLAPETWLPTTLFLGKGGFNVSARGDLLLGPVANPFLLPQGYSNTYWYKTYFSTYAPTSFVNVSSLGGSVTFRESVTLPATNSSGVTTPTLLAFMQREHLLVTSGANVTASNSQPWLRLSEDNLTAFNTVATLMPATLRATAFSGDINLVGSINLSPSPTGTADLLAAGAFNALQHNGTATINSSTVNVWISGRINLSDASPSAVSGITSPFAYQSLVGVSLAARSSSTSSLGLTFLSRIDSLFAETGSTTGSAAVIQTKQALHTQGLLHAGDTEPLRIYAGSGDISGLTLFSGKESRIISGNDITDIEFYLQNVAEDDVTVVASGRDIIASNSNSPLRVAARAPGNVLSGSDTINAGDIQINGPGTLEVLAGRNLDLGALAGNADGTGVGITSIGNGRNPYLPFEGAAIIAGAGLGGAGGLDGGAFDFDSFITQYVSGPQGAAYLTELAKTYPGLTTSSFASLPEDEQHRIALEVFYLVLRDAGRNQTTGIGGYETGFAAIATLFPNPGQGNIVTQSRDIRTRSGGSINLLAPGGGLTLQTTDTGSSLAPPGIITESGGSINIFTNDSVNLGISRIFTLRGGDIVIWSSAGDIAAGASSKTVASAPPTRVLIDPQSADVKTDLAGLATGGGIGVLATVAGVEPGNVDLIAPTGVVDAGDAGIRATGNLNIAATAVLNASNIAVSGASSGTPTAPVVSAPNIGGLTAAGNAAGASTSAAADAMKQSTPTTAETPAETPSMITVEVLGYGGSDPADENDEEKKRRKQL